MRTRKHTNTSGLEKALRQSHHWAFVAHYDGRWWIGNGYWVVAAEDWVNELLADYNLMPDRMTLDLEGRTVTTKRDLGGEPMQPPEVVTTFDSAIHFATIVLTAAPFGTGVEVVDMSGTRYSALLGHDDGGHLWAWVSAQYRAACETYGEVTEWRGCNPLKPLVGYDNKGQSRAILMPARIGNDLTLLEEAVAELVNS